MVLQEFEIRLHYDADGEGTCLSRGGTSARHHPLPGLRLSLAIVENCHSVRVRMIVRGRERFDLIALVADVMPRHPLAGAGEGLSVSEVEPRLQRSVVGLAARPKATAGRSAVERGVLYCACHESIPRRAESRTVQLVSNIYVRTPKNNKRHTR